VDIPDLVSQHTLLVMGHASQEFEVAGMSYDVDPRPTNLEDLFNVPAHQISQGLPWISRPAWLRIWRYTATHYSLKIKSTRTDKGHGFLGWDTYGKMVRVCDDNDSGLTLQFQGFLCRGKTETLQVTFMRRPDRSEFLQALIDHNLIQATTDVVECSSIVCTGGSMRLSPHVRGHDYSEIGAPAAAPQGAELAPSCSPAKRVKVDSEASDSGGTGKDTLWQDIDNLHSTVQKGALDAKCRALEAENRLLHHIESLMCTVARLETERDTLTAKCMALEVENQRLLHQIDGLIFL